MSTVTAEMLRQAATDTRNYHASLAYHVSEDCHSGCEILKRAAALDEAANGLQKATDRQDV